MILDTLALTDPLPVRRALACAPTTRHPFFQKCAADRPLHLLAQEGATLGDRMRHAFAWGFARGFGKVVLIGSDSPTLSLDLLRQAFAHLDDVPCVIGPTADGGYYLIGAAGGKAPDIFDGIPWGTDRVMRDTLHLLNDRQVPCALLAFGYDVDRPADLDFLSAHLALRLRQGAPVPTATWEVLQRWNVASI